MVSSIARYSIEMLRDEVCQLIERGLVYRRQPIYVLCQYIAPSEWVSVERELEENDFLIRDRIGDLVAREDWRSD